MNYLNNLKQLFLNNIYIVLVVALIAGCASVTDATPDFQQSEQTVTDSAAQGTDSDPIWFPTNRDQMDPIIDRPDDPQGN